ncbi:SIS domain-containing protein [Lacrimispora sp.]|uniref:SIS domain-containing protein n=1 Tax=Lacrimispora sp. TaxID=2719234 RepID=UPI0028A991FC|nr:SIS domain-containing protein [Lacrimispora sp.]
MIKYFEKQLKEIEDSIHSMDEGTFNKLLKESVETIDRGHKIIVSGLGKNVPICEKFVGSMVSLGMDACFLHTNSAIHGDMGVVREGDLLLLLTKSGETQESVYLKNVLSDRKINMWLLTFNKDSTLAKEIPNSLVLDLKHEGDLWNIMPNNSTTLNLIVLQGLAMQIAQVRHLDIGQFRINHPGGSIGEILKREQM